MRNAAAQLPDLSIPAYTSSATHAYFTLHNGALRNVALDAKGNVTEVRRTNGTVAASYGYSPFGQLLYQTNTYNQPFRFQTKLYHARSGFSYFGARWYDPKTGRWLSRDELGEAGGINLYQYCANNPINFIDPWGLEWLYINAERAGGSSGASGSGSAGWGHSWITLEDASGRQTSHGFWPDGGASPLGSLGGKHYPGDISTSSGLFDSGETPDGTFRVYISPDAYNRLAAGITHFQSLNPTWALSFNCTDFAAMVAKWAGVDVGDISTAGWSDPDKLADWISRQNQKKQCEGGSK